MSIPDTYNFTDENGLEYCFILVDSIPYIGTNTSNISAIDRSTTGRLTIPSYFQFNGMEYPVTHFSEFAFYSVQIKEIVFPKTATNLSGGVCESCQYLEYVDLLQTKIEVIPQYCFSFCNNLKTLLLPRSLKVIGNYSFYNMEIYELMIFDKLIEIQSEYSQYHTLKTIYYCGKSHNGLILPSNVTRVMVPYNYFSDTFSNIKVNRTITNCDFEFTCYPQIHYISNSLFCIVFAFILLK